MKLKLYQYVALSRELPEYNLKGGDVEKNKQSKLKDWVWFVWRSCVAGEKRTARMVLHRYGYRTPVIEKF